MILQETEEQRQQRLEEEQSLRDYENEKAESRQRHDLEMLRAKEKAKVDSVKVAHRSQAAVQVATLVCLMPALTIFAFFVPILIMMKREIPEFISSLYGD